jgi:ribosome biogenesis GTPase A
MSKCIGCGATLQFTEPNRVGYINNIEDELCVRCFKIKHYNEYNVVSADNKDFIKILKDINKNKSLVIFVVDILNLSEDYNLFKELLIDSKVLLVITKYDLLPINNHNKILKYFDKYNMKFVNKILISSKNNHNLDLLYEYIYRYKKGNEVGVVGFTNAGKSTLINKLIYNYGSGNNVITTSSLPSTTLGTIKVKVNNNLTLIDTPGILEEGNIINYLDESKIKLLTSKNKIKPITYQVKDENTFIIDNLLKVNVINNNITFYLPDGLKIKRYKKDVEIPLEKHTIEVIGKQDIVISGLGFIKVNKPGTIVISTIKNTKVYVRDSLI